jgi:hypothetical protein
MGAVPEPPQIRRPGKYARILIALQGLTVDEAIHLRTKDAKHFHTAKKQLLALVRPTGRRLLSSRTADKTEMWIWLEPKEESKVGAKSVRRVDRDSETRSGTYAAHR